MSKLSAQERCDNPGGLLMSKKQKSPVYSAFVLFDDETWIQPAFRVNGPCTDAAIEGALSVATGGFHVSGLQEDPEAPEKYVRVLNTKTRKWDK